MERVDLLPFLPLLPPSKEDDESEEENQQPQPKIGDRPINPHPLPKGDQPIPENMFRTFR